MGNTNMSASNKIICASCDAFDPAGFEPASFTVIDAVPNPGCPSGATWLPGLVCLSCNRCVALAKGAAEQNDEEISWQTLEAALTEESKAEKSGWYEMEGTIKNTL